MRTFQASPCSPAGHSRKTAVLFAVQLLFLACAGFLHVLGSETLNYNVIVFGNLCLYACIMVFCASDLRSRLVLLLFSLIVFVFLSCQPLIDCFIGTHWWEKYGREDTLFALRSTALSLLMIYLGAMLYALTRRKTGGLTRLAAADGSGRSVFDKPALQMAALCLYAVSMGCFLYGEVDKLLFMRGRSYPEYYLSYDAAYPFWIRTAGYCMPYALCAFLATLPKKKAAFPALALYLLSAVPVLTFGQRNPIVLNALFIFLYYCIRDYLGDKKRWLGRWEVGAIIVLIPLAFVGLSAVNYLRGGSASDDKVVVNLIVDLFHKQGVSFRTLCAGHAALPNLPGAKRNFTFGPFIDQVLYSRIGLLLFGTDPLPIGNSVELAARSHRLADPLAFVAHPDYLKGNGLGSSYLLELFADYGYIGIAIYSLLLGVFLLWCMDAMKKGWFVKTLTLVCFTDLFYIPRAAATGWLVFLIQIHFWFVILACLLGEKILGRLFPRLRARQAISGDRLRPERR